MYIYIATCVCVCARVRGIEASLRWLIHDMRTRLLPPHMLYSAIEAEWRWLIHDPEPSCIIYVSSRTLTYALTCADVCCRRLTYADVC